MPMRKKLCDLPELHLRELRKVARKHGFPLMMIAGRERGYPLCRARDEAIAACRRLGYSLPSIGVIFGMRHHTTILHSIRKEERRRAQG